MKYLKKSIAVLLAFFILVSCKKGGTDSTTTKTAPANLVITAVASTDSSGNVAFIATADNAVTYAYEFGNGDIKTVPSGAINYQYTLLGINTYTVTVTATSASGLTLKKTTAVTVNVKTVVAGLFWSEEFNVDGPPDPTKWGYDLGAGGWGNAELQYYTGRPENSVVKDGVLKINAIRENYNGSTFTSARLLSKGKFDFTYGKVEVRAKVPAGVGTWPAIWMLGSNISTTPWPGCGEIDIMEHLGRTLNTIYGTLHYPGRFGGTADGNTKVIPGVTTAFHIYTLDWSATAIKIYADDQLVHTVANSSNIPFNSNFFLILNLAMGGNFGGPVDASVTNATMEIDYIRVYK